MADEKVSVIIPVYNVEQYLRRCLDSIINQTYQNLEIILVDDGSSDNSGVICEEYASMDARITVIHQGNSGVSSARNTALSKATGEYIIFVDSDDSILPDYVKNLMSIGADDYVVSGCCVQNAHNEWEVWENLPLQTTLDQIKRVPEIIHRIPTGMVWAHRYKRSIIEKYSILFRNDISRGEDTLFNCSYLHFCDTIAVINSPDYHYFYNRTSATSKLNTKLFRWSMESVMAIGNIIGTNNQAFHERVWTNAMTVCDNYLLTARNNSVSLKFKLLHGVFEVCCNSYVRKSLHAAYITGDKKTALLVKYYLYPFYLLLWSFR